MRLITGGVFCDPDLPALDSNTTPLGIYPFRSFSQYASTIDWLKTRLTAAGKRRKWWSLPGHVPVRCCAGRLPLRTQARDASARIASSVLPLPAPCFPPGFGYRFISGSMPLKQRARAIQQ